MARTELQQITELLSNQYGSGLHWEVVYAEKDEKSGKWNMEVRRIETDNNSEE